VEVWGISRATVMPPDRKNLMKSRGARRNNSKGLDEFEGELCRWKQIGFCFRLRKKNTQRGTNGGGLTIWPHNLRGDESQRQGDIVNAVG